MQELTRVVFLFQAEDVIRDGRVTGVQTCALPISPDRRVPAQDWERHGERLAALTAELGRAGQALKSLAITLSDKRRQAAERLQRVVQQERSEERSVGKEAGYGRLSAVVNRE